MVRARRAPVPDGRVNNGGARQGTPGQPYANRSDLATQKISVAPGQPYGQGAAQRRAQQAVPMAAAPPTPTPTGPPGQGPMQTPPPTGPPPDPFRPTERPDEPVTAGLPTGPGPGPEALPIQPSTQTDPLAIQLRALYQRYPSVELANLLADVR